MRAGRGRSEDACRAALKNTREIGRRDVARLPQFQGAFAGMSAR